MKPIFFLMMLSQAVLLPAAEKDYSVNVTGKGSHSVKSDCIRLAKADYDKNYIAELKICAEKYGRLKRREAKSWQEPRGKGWECGFWTLQTCNLLPKPQSK